MATINFPSSPALNQAYTFEGRSWIWNGKGWEAVHSEVAGGQLGTTFSIDAGAVFDEQVNAAAAIAGSKIVPNFSSQTGAVALASGTTAQRPASPVTGMIRYNSTLDVIEAYIGSTWAAIISGGFDFGTLSGETVDDYGLVTAAVTESSDYGALT